MANSEWATVLAGMPLFDGVGKRDLRRIATSAEFREFAPGDMVVATGGPSDGFYVVLSGEARASWRPAARPLTTGDYFGEIGLLDGRPRSASVVATSDLHVMRLRRGAFDDALDRNPTIARTFLSELGSRVRELEHQAALR
jgi:CRP/FNR family transcriptional regulator, cyclic AMP receptor protein